MVRPAQPPVLESTPGCPRLRPRLEPLTVHRTKLMVMMELLLLPPLAPGRAAVCSALGVVPMAPGLLVGSQSGELLPEPGERSELLVWLCRCRHLV